MGFCNVSGGMTGGLTAMRGSRKFHQGGERGPDNFLAHLSRMLMGELIVYQSL